MIKRHVITPLLPSALVLIGGLILWITHDEEPLDYNAMNIELGPKDPAVNGYTKLKEIVDNMSFDMGVIVNGRPDGELPDQNPFATPPERLTKAEMREIVDNNRALFADIDAAFALEHFKVDTEPNIEIVISHIVNIHKYVKVRCLEARLLAMDGDPEAALRLLIEVDQKIARLSQGGSSLVSMMSAVVSANITNETLAYLISHYKLSDQALRQAMADYPLRGILVDHFDEAIKFEFHFVMNALDDLQDNPETLVDYMSDVPNNPEALVDYMSDVPGFLMVLVYKPNMTLNNFYRQYHQIVAHNDKPFVDRRTIQLSKRPMHELILSGNAAGEMILNTARLAITTVLERAVLADFRSECVYLMMAVRRYQLEHGEYPPTLTALVPDYIEAVPLDPYDGEPIHYDAQQAVLYGMGLDGLDDGPSPYISRFDHNHPDYEDRMMLNKIAEKDGDDPTFHIRFDQEPIEAEPAPENKHP